LGLLAMTVIYLVIDNAEVPIKAFENKQDALAFAHAYRWMVIEIPFVHDQNLRLMRVQEDY
jgi:hypothetical protein